METAIMKTSTTPLNDAVITRLGYSEDDVDPTSCEYEELESTLRDVATHGADTGWPGFTYYTDTTAFFLANRAAIVARIKDDADSCGTDPVSLVAKFGCLDDSPAIRDEIGRAIYGGPLDEPDDGQVSNALAWYALEETARELTDE
jgi:hypothetical protein